MHPIDSATQTTRAINFFSSGLRQKVDQLMDILWAGGVNNPMDSIEQISYLLFLRLLSEKDEALASARQEIQADLFRRVVALCLGQLRYADRRQLFDAVRDAIEKPPRAARPDGDRQAPLQPRHAQDLRPADAARRRPGDPRHRPRRPRRPRLQGRHVRVPALSKLAASGTNGQFRTPRHIIDLIVALVEPAARPADLRPGLRHGGLSHLGASRTSCAGTRSRPISKRGIVDGSLLKPAQWKFLEEQAFTGFDNDANMVKIAILNLYLHQLEKAHIEHFNPLTTGFGGSYPGPAVRRHPREPAVCRKGAGREHPLRPQLQAEHPRDRAAVPEVVHRPPGAGRPGRRHRAEWRAVRLDERRDQPARAAPDRVRPAGRHQSAERRLQALLRRRHRRAHLREGRARPKASGSTTSPPTASASTTSARRSSANDIPDVLAKWPSREEGPNSYRVPIEKIRENDWSLAAGRYKAGDHRSREPRRAGGNSRRRAQARKRDHSRGKSLLAQIGGKK